MFLYTVWTIVKLLHGGLRDNRYILLLAGLLAALMSSAVAFASDNYGVIGYDWRYLYFALLGFAWAGIKIVTDQNPLAENSHHDSEVKQIANRYHNRRRNRSNSRWRRQLHSKPRSNVIGDRSR